MQTAARLVSWWRMFISIGSLNDSLLCRSIPSMFIACLLQVSWLLPNSWMTCKPLVSCFPLLLILLLGMEKFDTFSLDLSWCKLMNFLIDCCIGFSAFTVDVLVLAFFLVSFLVWNLGFLTSINWTKKKGIYSTQPIRQHFNAVIHILHL